jgi:hypothetical protein
MAGQAWCDPDPWADDAVLVTGASAAVLTGAAIGWFPGCYF